MDGLLNTDDISVNVTNVINLTHPRPLIDRAPLAPFNFFCRILLHFLQLFSPKAPADVESVEFETRLLPMKLLLELQELLPSEIRECGRFAEFGVSVQDEACAETAEFETFPLLSPEKHRLHH